MFKKLLIPTLTLAAAAATLQSCATATASRSEPLTIESQFSGIAVHNNIDVVYTPGTKVSYIVEATADAKSKLKMEVNAGILDISAKDAKDPIKIELTAPGLNSFLTTNNSSVTIAGNLTLDNLKANALNNSSLVFSQAIETTDVSIRAANNADIKFSSLKSNVVSVSSANNSDIELKGTCNNVTFTATNNSDIDASGLKAATGAATATNLAEIKANVKSLTMSTSNLGEIHNL